MSRKLKINVKLYILKKLFNMLDLLSNIEKLHKHIISNKIYLGTAIISLTIASNACSSKNGTNSEKSPISDKKDTSKKNKTSVDTPLKTIQPTNKKVTVGPPPSYNIDSDVIFVTNDFVSCYVIMIDPQTFNKKDSVSELENEKPIYTIVEEDATFQGGDLVKARDYIQSQIIYPQQSIDNGSEGRIIIQFVVMKTGYVDKITVLWSSGDLLLDNEAIRVIKNMPQWVPGKESGSNVNQQFTLPIYFKLPKTK